MDEDGGRQSIWFNPIDYLLSDYLDIQPPVCTHIAGIDDLLGGGFTPGMWAVMAAPGTGKSALMLYCAMLIAWGGVPCAYLSLEMSAAQCWHRVTSAFSTTSAAKRLGIPKFRWSDVPTMAVETVKAMDETGRGIYDMAAEDAFVAATKALTMQPVEDYKPLQLHIAGMAGLRALDDVLTAIDEAHDMGCGLVTVDYMQLIDPPRGMSQNERLTEVSHAITAKAAELSIPVMAICAMNREGLKSGKKPTMHDLSGSSAIEYDSTGVISLSAIEDEGTEDVRRVSLNVHKNRGGRLDCSVRLDYEPAYNVFKDVPWMT